jgi:hypothetical protein
MVGQRAGRRVPLTGDTAVAHPLDKGKDLLGGREGLLMLRGALIQ